MAGPVFSERQVEIVRLAARGLTHREIAAELGLSPRTSKWHLDVLRARLGVSTAREIPEAYMQQTGDDPYPRAAA